MSDILLTAEEVAEKIGMKGKSSAAVINRWRRQGRIPAAVVEHKFVRYDLEDVLEALAKRAKKKKPL